MNPDYDCYNGAIRVYQPVTIGACQGRYLDPNSLEQMGTETVLDFFRRAFSSNTNFYENFFTLDKCRMLIQEHRHRMQLDNLETQHSEKLKDAYQTGEQTCSLIEQDLNLTRQQLKEAKSTLSERDRQITSLQAAVKNAHPIQNSQETRTLLPALPTTVGDVITYFQNAFPDRIVFAGSSLNSAKYCILPLPELWQYLYALATTMWDLAFQGDGDIYAQFQQRTGIECARGEGKQTRKDPKLMRSLRLPYEGESIDIEPHITNSRLGQSIHFGFSREKNLVVIGHCGKHKKIYSTRKVK